jgi:hypothetical protein
MGTKLHTLLKLLSIVITIMPFMWFYNILSKEKANKKTKIQIRPKAKPNRVKNIKK